MKQKTASVAGNLILLLIASLTTISSLSKEIPKEGLALNWEEAASVEHDDGTKTLVLASSIEGTSLLAFKGTRFFKYSPEQLLWLIMDMKQRENWIELYDQMNLVGSQPNPPFHLRLHQKLLSPFALLTPRDFVIEVKAFRLKGSDPRKIYIAAKSIEDPQAPLLKDYVRMNITFSLWKIQPGLLKTEDGKEIQGSFVSLEVLTDPMGSIPNFVVNFIQKKYPINLFNRMIAHLSTLNPLASELPPIEEPDQL